MSFVAVFKFVHLKHVKSLQLSKPASKPQAIIYSFFMASVSFKLQNMGVKEIGESYGGNHILLYDTKFRLLLMFD